MKRFFIPMSRHLCFSDVGELFALQSSEHVCISGTRREGEEMKEMGAHVLLEEDISFMGLEPIPSAFRGWS